MIGTNRFPPKNDKNSGNLTSLKRLYNNPAMTPAITPANTPISIVSLMAVIPFVSTRYPTAPARAAAPLPSFANPMAIPIAKMRARFSSIPFPAAVINGIPNISSIPSLTNNAAAGRVAIGNISDFPIRCKNSAYSKSSFNLDENVLSSNKISSIYIVVYTS